MKQLFRHPALVIMGFVAQTLVGPARPAAAAQGAGATPSCPEQPPSDPLARREVAREWFSRAEKAENAGQDAAAIRAYVCSMKIIPHASTAYNLARAAERGGDLELAVNSYRRYLALDPGAPDKADVEKSIASLETRLAEGRRPLVPTTPVEGSGPGTATGPLPGDPPLLPPPPPLPEGGGVTAGGAAGTSDRVDTGGAPSRIGATELIIAGGAVAALGTGLVLNFSARSKMDECRSLARANNLVTAQQRCDSARPLAYASYALFGTAVVAAALDVFLVWRKPRAVESVNVAITPTSATLSFVTPL